VPISDVAGQGLRPLKSVAAVRTDHLLLSFRCGLVHRIDTLFVSDLYQISSSTRDDRVISGNHDNLAGSAGAQSERRRYCRVPGVRRAQVDGDQPGGTILGNIGSHVDITSGRKRHQALRRRVQSVGTAIAGCSWIVGECSDLPCILSQAEMGRHAPIQREKDSKKELWQTPKPLRPKRPQCYAIHAALSRLEPGLARYVWLQHHLMLCDVRSDERFKRCFQWLLQGAT
jgi:hypothetical protein